MATYVPMAEQFFSAQATAAYLYLPSLSDEGGFGHSILESSTGFRVVAAFSWAAKIWSMKTYSAYYCGGNGFQSELTKYVQQDCET